MKTQKIIKEILKAVEEKQMKIKDIMILESKAKEYVMVILGEDEKEITMGFETKEIAEEVLKDLFVIFMVKEAKGKDVEIIDELQFTKNIESGVIKALEEQGIFVKPSVGSE